MFVVRGVLAAILLAAIPFVAVNSLSQDAQPPGQQAESRGQAGDEQGSEFWPPIYGYRLKITDTLLVAVTFLLFVATLALWWSTRSLVKGAELTSERQLRAYLVVNVKDFVWPRSQGGPLTITLEIKNTGQTPAHDLRSLSRTAFLDYPLSPGFDFSLPFSQDPSVGLLGPGESIYITASDQLTGDEWLVLKWDKKKRLCTYGTLTYRDIFDASRHTNICIIHDVTVDETTGRITLNSITAPYHNDAI